MMCPYCAEEIKDEAIACRWCRRDFFLMKPLLDRLNKLEQRIAETRLQVEQVATTGRLPASSVQRPAPNSLFSPRGMSILGLFVVFYLIFAQLDVNSGFDISDDLRTWLLIFGFLGLPFIFGVVLGFNVTVDRPFLLFFFVFLIGVTVHMTVLGIPLIYLLANLHLYLPSSIGAALLLLAASFFGRFVARKWLGSTAAVEPAVAFARRYYTGKGLPSGEESQKIKRLAEAINAFTPILTFFATILGAYLTYLGAIAKGGG